MARKLEGESPRLQPWVAYVSYYRGRLQENLPWIRRRARRRVEEGQTGARTVPRQAVRAVLKKTSYRLPTTKSWKVPNEPHPDTQ